MLPTTPASSLAAAEVGDCCSCESSDAFGARVERDNDETESLNEGDLILLFAETEAEGLCGSLPCFQKESGRLPVLRAIEAPSLVGGLPVVSVLSLVPETEAFNRV